MKGSYLAAAGGLAYCLAAGGALADHHHHHHGDCAGGERECVSMFSRFDDNGDGFLSKQEYYEGRSKHMAERAAAGGKMRHAGNMPTFEDIDTDSDGSISPAEFDAHHAKMREERKKEQPEAA